MPPWLELKSDFAIIHIYTFWFWSRVESLEHSENVMFAQKKSVWIFKSRQNSEAENISHNHICKGR